MQLRNKLLKHAQICKAEVLLKTGKTLKKLRRLTSITGNQNTMRELDNIPHPLEVKCHRGLTWRPYSVDFESPDGRFSCYIYAISPEHAELQLQALKETGQVTGSPEAIIPF